MEIKYSYAKDIKGHIVHIKDALPGGLYYCPQCGNEMIPKMGDIKVHHFAHKVECSCNGESYLHRIAKIKFKEILGQRQISVAEANQYHRYAVHENVLTLHHGTVTK